MTTQVERISKGQKVGDCCPRCGKEGESDPDGFYCPSCDSYWDVGDYRERWAELRDDNDDSQEDYIHEGSFYPICEEDEE